MRWIHDSQGGLETWWCLSYGCLSLPDTVHFDKQFVALLSTLSSQNQENTQAPTQRFGNERGKTQLIFSATHASRNLVTRASLAVTLSKWLLHVSLACWGQFFRKVIHSTMAPYCLASLGSDLWGLARKHITNGRARHSGLFFQRIFTIPSCTCFNSFLGMSDMCAA